ncbi:MAG: MarR family winged helix-turn-helix transcriptional regulator [Nocardioidaceae bacterium]
MTPRKSAAPRTIKIEQQVCFSLHAAARTYDALYRDLLAPHDLSYPQYLVLIVLGQSGPMSVNEVGAVLRLDSGTLSPLLKRLDAKGLVSRERDPADERRVQVSLTRAGSRTLANLADVPAQVAKASGMTMPELRRLMDNLRATTAAADEHIRARSR